MRAEPWTDKRRLAIARGRSDAAHARGDVPGLVDVDITAANSKTMVQKYFEAMGRI